MLDKTDITSDNETGIAIIEIDGEPDLSMTDSSSVSNITLTTTSNTVGSISTSGEIGCLQNCIGFTDTGSYGFNIHGVYRNVTSANWVLTEAEGTRKTAKMKVKLLSRPVNDVQVLLSSSDSTEATLDKYSLIFSPADWNRSQELTISGEDDSVVDDDVRVRIIGYTESTDTNYSSTSANRAHAFKYTFTNINDDLQKGLSPIVQIGEDQKVNEKTRVILDGSASYDPDPTGRIISYKWKYVGQRTDITIERDSESISNFSAPDISEATVLLFGLEVVDDDLTAAYGSTSVTVMPIVELSAVANVTGAITPKYPEGSILDNVTSTDPDVAKSHKLVSGETELNIDMKTDGTVFSKVKTEDGSESKVNVPLGADFNMNQDASISILKTLESGSQLSTNISSVGEVTVGVGTSGTGSNVKAPKGSEVKIGTDGTSSISLPATTDSSTGITKQVISTLSPDGSTITEITLSGGSGRTTNADGSSGTIKSSLSTESGLTVAIDTSNGVAASMAITGGTLGASIANDGTSSTSYDTGSAKSTFSSTTSMDLQIKSGEIVSTSSAATGNDGVSRTISSTINNSKTSVQVKGSGISDSTLEAATGSTVTINNNRTVTSTFAPDSSMTSTITINSEGLMHPVITTVSTNDRQILPEVEPGGTVSQESGKVKLTIPLNTSGNSRTKSRRSSALRTSQRTGVSSEYAVTGKWVGVDSISGKPIYVQSASSDATLEITNEYDNTTSISLSAGTAEYRIGDALPSSLSSTLNVKSIPASITMNGSRNLVALPAYTSIAPASFENHFSSYKTVWVRRNGAWQFYTSGEEKSIYIEKGYSELSSNIEAGEGFWIELKSPANPTNFEIADYGGYSALPQLSSMTSEWNLLGTSKNITVEEITQAGNFDQTIEDEANTLGFIDNSGGSGPPSGQDLLQNEYIMATNQSAQFNGFAFLLAMLLLASASLMFQQRQSKIRNISKSQQITLKIPLWQLAFAAGMIMLAVACAPPQSDSTSETFDYSGSYDRVHSIWKWDDQNSKWLAYSPKSSIAQELEGLGYTTFSTVEKGQGYWVRLSVSGIPASLSLAEPPAI